MYITRTVVGKHTKGQVTIKKTPGGGDAIVAGPFPDMESAYCSDEFKRAQRHLVLADNEEVRIHASNGGYLFSVRNGPDGPSLLYDRGFTGLAQVYEAKVELFPWRTKEAAK